MSPWLWLLACSSGEEATAQVAPAPVEAPAGPRGVALIVSHDLDGEIEPCG